MDVESHNDMESIAKNETSIWLGCYLDENSKVDDESSYFYTIREFLERIRIDSSKKRNKAKTRLISNLAIYIYNASFEWSFILPHMLEMGFKWKAKISDEDEMVFNTIGTKSCSSIWEVNIKFSAKNGIVKLRDLAKMFSGGLGKVAKSFNLETQKGEIDYTLNRLHDYKVTAEEKEYCFKDTRIIIEILEKMTDDKDFWNSISASSYAMKKLIKRGYPKSYRPYKMFRASYPELDEEETNFLREGVEGGITYAPEGYQFKDIAQKIVHIDAHQMHPTSAYKNLFPYGKGEYFKGKPP